jgi:glycosyltransferase involved in cell wall biosynthesis
MRVVLDGRIVLDRMTGAGRYVRELARHLPRLDPDLELILLLHQSLGRTEVPRLLTVSGARVHYCQSRVAGVRQWLEVPLTLRALRPDVYHYPFIDLPLVHCPSVVTVYDLNPLLDPQYFARHGVIKRWGARQMMRSALRRCRVALAISEATRNAVQQQFPEVISKVRVVPLAVDLDFWVRGEVAGPAPNGPPWENRVYILYVGVERPHKNLGRLVRAFVRFRSSEGWRAGEGPYLWLAGVGAGSEQLRAEVYRGACAGDVRLSPPLSDSALVGVYRRAHTVAYVSTSEGFGLPLLEAFAVGVPVLASDRGSLPEVGGDAVLYVDPTDETSIAQGLARLWREEGLRALLVERGLRRVRMFSWQATAAGTLQGYRDALTMGGHPVSLKSGAPMHR